MVTKIFWHTLCVLEMIAAILFFGMALIESQTILVRLWISLGGMGLLIATMVAIEEIIPATRRRK